MLFFAIKSTTLILLLLLIRLSTVTAVLLERRLLKHNEMVATSCKHVVRGLLFHKL